MIDPRDRDFATICICAVRYSLGRMTYMPGLVQSFVAPRLKFFDKCSLEVLAHDIREHGSVYGEKAYGMDFDYKDWMRFLERVEDEIRRRDHDQL